MTGDQLVAKLSTTTTSNGPLIQSLSYLQQSDIDGAQAQASAVRMDLTPSLNQAPAQNPSLLATEAGLAVDTHTGAAQLSTNDLAIKGRGLDFSMNRNYVSDALQAGPLGSATKTARSLPAFAPFRPEMSTSIPGMGPAARSRSCRRAARPDRSFQAPPGVFADLYHPSADSYLLLLPDHTLLAFDESGRLQRISDRNTTKIDGSDGNSMKFSYDGAGRLASVLDATNRPINFTWDSATELLARLTDFDGRTVAYSYDPSGRLTKVVGPDPASTSSQQPQTSLAWTSSSGDLKTKLYRGGELTSATDGENRQVFAVNYAQPSVASAVALGGGTWQIGTSGILNDDHRPERK